MNVPETGTVVSGIGNEIITFLGIMVGLTTFCFVLRMLWREGAQQVLHPERTQAVQSTRTDMGVAPSSSAVPAENCPVCLGRVQHSIQTNCGHRFCAECMLEYWRHDQWPRPARCPVCRATVTLLMGTVAGDVGERILDYNQRMSGEWRPLLSYLSDIPTILRHLWQELFSERGPYLVRRLHLGYIFLILLVYVLLPFDILPESALGLLGYLDDLVLAIIAMVYISFLYRSFLSGRT